VLIGLASGSSQTRATVRPFMQAQGMRYPVILDTARTITAYRSRAYHNFA